MQDNKHKKYIYLYKTINIINNKEYIGIHTTNNLRDGYIGNGITSQKNAEYYSKTSSIPFVNAVVKYGYDYFIKEVLYFFDTYEEASEAEESIVNLEYVKRKNTYNIKTGGVRGVNSKFKIPYDFTDLESNRFTGDSLEQFCEDKQLNYVNMQRLRDNKIDRSKEGYRNTEKVLKLDRIVIVNTETEEIYKTYDLILWCKKHIPTQSSKSRKPTLLKVLTGDIILSDKKWWCCYEKEYKGYVELRDKKPRTDKIHSIVDKYDNEHIFTSPYTFCRENNLNVGNFYNMLNGKTKQHRGFKLKK